MIEVKGSVDYCWHSFADVSWDQLSIPCRYTATQQRHGSGRTLTRLALYVQPSYELINPLTPTAATWVSYARPG